MWLRPTCARRPLFISTAGRKLLLATIIACELLLIIATVRRRALLTKALSKTDGWMIAMRSSEPENNYIM